MGSLNVSSGSVIFNGVDVTPNLGDISKERVFNAANNTSGSVTNFSFDNALVGAFHANVSVVVSTSGGNKYTFYDLKGVQKDSTWVLNSTFVGDNTGLTFAITSAGQIQYTSPNFAGWSSTTMKFRALTTTK